MLVQVSPRTTTIRCGALPLLLLVPLCWLFARSVAATRHDHDYDHAVTPHGHNEALPVMKPDHRHPNIDYSPSAHLNERMTSSTSHLSIDLDPSSSSPLEATVVIIRHGEKLNWPQGVQPSEVKAKEYIDNHKLSAKGYERASALVSYFQHRDELVAITNGRKFDHIVSQAVDTGPDPLGESERPEETVKPYAESMKRNVTKYTKKNISQAISFMKSQKNSTILVCEDVRRTVSGCP
ncbi:hypothetical protein SeMB42_g03805 [Synchytrium endobioticum]|uniref:Phosphoglycerate mutase (2,3-diphosphoglycerate-dependent) n=1 Tax=Synchytrium endobioticum TaxID=286115 RepID=A0A507D3T7_9FUNG|nr:hypothetical protein SeMB42_g03805 [Synchytrium endobioticum]